MRNTIRLIRSEARRFGFSKLEEWAVQMKYNSSRIAAATTAEVRYGCR